MPNTFPSASTSRRHYPSPTTKLSTKLAFASIEKPAWLPTKEAAVEVEHKAESCYSTRDILQEPCHVRFAPEQDNQAISSPWTDFTQEDFDNLWYTEDEMYDMKEQALMTAKRVAAKRQQDNNNDDNYHRHGLQWHKALNVAYRAFCYAESVNDLQHVMAMVTHQRDLLIEPAAIQVLGLEKWLVKSFAKDRIRRRNIMLEEIMYCQFQAINSFEHGNNVDETIGEICRDISRSSRMFAFHVGQMLAMQIDEYKRNQWPHPSVRPFLLQKKNIFHEWYINNIQVLNNN